MRRAARTDLNQKMIVSALREAGATVQHLHGVGQGCPDIAVGHRSLTYLLEIKAPGGSLTPQQLEWHQNWRGHAIVVENVEDALRAIGVIDAD